MLKNFLCVALWVCAGAALAEGYYVRADFGYSWTWDQETRTVLKIPAPNVSVGTLAPEGVPLGQVGFGYFASPYARADVTASMTGHREYAVGCAPEPSLCDPGTTGTAQIDTSTLFVNVYYELASLWTLEETWYHPYIGIGIGAAYHNVHHVVGVLPVPGQNYESYINANADWEFAWRGTAGIAFNLYKGLMVDMAYVYMDAGEAEFGDTFTFNFQPGALYASEPATIDMKTNEAYIGLRYQF